MQPQYPQPNQGSLPPVPAASVPQQPATELPFAATEQQPAIAQTEASNTTLSEVNKTTLPDTAGDNDTIEVGWIHKIKQVFKTTSGDPFETNKQFSQLKAEYMQKRYGKQVKTDS